MHDGQAIGLAEGEVGVTQADGLLVLGVERDGITRVDGHRRQWPFQRQDAAGRIRQGDGEIEVICFGTADSTRESRRR